MSREIKFRAWDAISSTMLTLEISVQSGRYSIQPGNGFGAPRLEGLMQFTGLKDKNGTDIYEGDVLHSSFYDWPGARQVVKFEKDLNDIDGNFEAVGWAVYGHVAEYEVIGNIYENPELLGETQ